MSLPNLFSPSATFEAPLEMLAACHGRIERQCETLRRLVPHVAAHGSDQAAREAAQAVLRYFDHAALDHHADEEQDLFPALLEAMAGSDAVCLRDLTEQLTRQHRELEAHWRALRPELAIMVGSVAMAEIIRDKWASYEWARANALPFARSAIDAPALSALHRDVGLPLVAKPPIAL